jgi:hypothetical protein
VVGRDLAPLAALLLAACASQPKDPEGAFFAALATNGEVRLTGWAQVKGAEFMIFPDRNAVRSFLARAGEETWPDMNAAEDWPESTKCVTAFFGDWRRHSNRIYDGRRVAVTGKVMDYEALPDRGGDFLPQTKVWGDRAVGNWCFGRKVLLLSSVSLAE